MGLGKQILGSKLVLIKFKNSVLALSQKGILNKEQWILLQVLDMCSELQSKVAYFLQVSCL